jgi:hypothetical protein
MHTSYGLSKVEKQRYVGIVLAVMFLPMLWAPIMGVFTIPFGLVFLLMAAVS